VLNLTLGIAFSWSVFIRPLMGSFGWTKTEATLPFTLFIIALALTMVPAGRAQDRIGPRKVAIFGGIVLGLGLMLASFIDYFRNPLWLYLTFGLIAGTGTGLAYACTIPAARKWFPDKPGLAVGLVTTGSGMSALLFAPLQRYLIEAKGLPMTFLIVGGVVLIVSAFAAYLLSNPPEGWRPKGWKRQESATTPTVAAAKDYRPTQVIKSVRFWMVWVMFAFMSAAGLMVIGHIAAYAEEIGLAAMHAAAAAGILSGFNAIGRPASGMLSDKTGVLKSMLILFTIQGAMMLIFPHFAVAIVTIYISVAIIGFNFGANFTLFPSVTAAFFGTKNLGTNYGLVFTAYGAGATLGPIMASYLYDATQSYTTAFTIAAVLIFLSVVIALVLNHRHPQKVAQAEQHVVS
jgi:OFA family oxalate/formate antiporter-like MFS transporter